MRGNKTARSFLLDLKYFCTVQIVQGKVNTQVPAPKLQQSSYPPSRKPTHQYWQEHTRLRWVTAPELRKHMGPSAKQSPESPQLHFHTPIAPPILLLLQVTTTNSSWLCWTNYAWYTTKSETILTLFKLIFIYSATKISRELRELRHLWLWFFLQNNLLQAQALGMWP